MEFPLTSDGEQEVVLCVVFDGFEKLVKFFETSKGVKPLRKCIMSMNDQNLSNYVKRQNISNILTIFDFFIKCSKFVKKHH